MTRKTQSPEWIRHARRFDRPKIDYWFKPEHSPLDGVLIWRGTQPYPRTGAICNIYAIQDANTGHTVGVSERVALRDLRQVGIGSRVYIEFVGYKTLPSGFDMQEFKLYVEDTQPEPSGEVVKDKHSTLPKEQSSVPVEPTSGSEEERLHAN